jgi:hypothetical protein
MKETKKMKTTIKSNLKRIVTAAVCGVISIILLVVGISTIGNRVNFARTAQAQEETKSSADESSSSRRFRCSNATLTGRYAIRGDGFVPSGPPPAPMVPFATVGIMTLDVFGNLSNAVTVSNNGMIMSNIDSGTYTVNADCRGTMTIMIPAPPFQLNFNLVVADRGKEFYLISTTPSVVTVGGKRVE